MLHSRMALILIVLISALTWFATESRGAARYRAAGVTVGGTNPSSDAPAQGAGETAGLLGPVGPKEIGCTGIGVRPGDHLQDKVEAAGVGATICFAPGLYPAQHVSPLPFQTFVGLKGAVLDGQNQVRRAFDGTARDVVIRNLVIRNYTAGSQDAAVYAAHGIGWRVLDNDICCNAGIGVSMGEGTVLAGNIIHHNAQAGYGTAAPGAPRVENNEIAFNNAQGRSIRVSRLAAARYLSATERKFGIIGSMTTMDRGSGPISTTRITRQNGIELRTIVAVGSSMRSPGPRRFGITW